MKSRAGISRVSALYWCKWAMKCYTNPNIQDCHPFKTSQKDTEQTFLSGQWPTNRICGRDLTPNNHLGKFPEYSWIFENSGNIILNIQDFCASRSTENGNKHAGHYHWHQESTIDCFKFVSEQTNIQNARHSWFLLRGMSRLVLENTDFPSIPTL